MRILHIDTGLGLRGGQRQALLLMQTLRQAGHDCSLMAHPHGELWKEAQSFNVLKSSVVSLLRISSQFDLIHAHDAHAHTLAAMASRVPFVVSRRVAFPVSTSFASRWKYRRPARFLAVSQFVAQQLQNAGIPAGKIDIVYDAIEAFSPAAAWNPTGPVVALASEDPQKGRDLVERASHIAGTSILYSHNLSNDLLHASLFLYISRSEGFGSAALLAMSMGIPVIASRIPGLQEVLANGESGLLVDNEPNAIAQAIQLLQQNETLAQSLSQNAKHRVSKHFNTDNLLNQTLSCYRRALGL